MGKTNNDKSGNGSAAENGAAESVAKGAKAAELNPEVAQKIAQVRARVRESFGNVAMAMMMMPRYRNQTLGDLQHLLLEPLLRDRVAIAYPGNKDGGERDPLSDVAGMAIWASVSEEVDVRIRDQVRAGTFPVRLKPADWTSGEINWLLDIIAPDSKTTANVIANFRQVVKDGNLRLHPIVTKLVDKQTLEKMGAEKMGKAE